MQLQIKDHLPFVSMIVVHRRQMIKVQNVLVDTGSGGTIFSADTLSKIGVFPEPEDTLHTIFGVGGSEVFYP